MNFVDGSRNNRILVIDDNPSIHADVRKILTAPSHEDRVLAEAGNQLFGESKSSSACGLEFHIDSAFQGEDGILMVLEAARLRRPYAMAFIDVRMPPGINGVETLARIWHDQPDLQVVMCTAHSDYSWEEMIRKVGRTDNLVILKKPFDNIEVLQLAHTLTEKWWLSHQLRSRLSDLDRIVTLRTRELQEANEHLRLEISERRQVESALRLSEERFSKAFKASPIPMAIQSFEGLVYVDANTGFERLTGFSMAELAGRTPVELRIWDYAGGASALLSRLREHHSARNLAAHCHTKYGEFRDVLLSAELFELDDRPYVLTIAQDITDQIKLENQLRQAQKMEAVGQLAAGLAHDFNNILTVVQGHSTILLNSRPTDSPDSRSLKTICAAAERATKLVRQLLTFSRKQVRQARPTHVKDLLASVPEMFPRVLGEHIKVNLIVPPNLPQINADATMIEQMVMNLALNARDAMSDGGTLTIEVAAVKIGPEEAQRNQDARPGSYVCLTVADTGCGMPQEILPRIFEPFFTTKPVGKGTGLGLASVYGIARQHDGWVEVQSEVGLGSVFQVYLPVSTTIEEQDIALSRTTIPATGGRETILVVEDEPDLREFVVHLLQRNGYQVLEAESGVAALDLWTHRSERTDLLVTDMVMPGGIMGRELAARLVQSDPRLRVIYTSGYSPGMAGKDLALLEGRNFLPKPYPPELLLRMVRESLDRK